MFEWIRMKNDNVKACNFLFNLNHVITFSFITQFYSNPCSINWTKKWAEKENYYSEKMH